MRGWILLALVAVASPAAGDQIRVKPLDKGGTYGCSKDSPAVRIPNGAGTYTFTGRCVLISIVGGMNTVTAEDVSALEIVGAKNTVSVGSVNRITFSGIGNTVTWKKAVSGDKPRVEGQVAKNTVIKGK